MNTYKRPSISDCVVVMDACWEPDVLTYQSKTILKACIYKKKEIKISLLWFISTNRLKLQYIFLFLVSTDGGVRRRPAQRPRHCQHPGHWRQWQYAHVWRGLLQRWSLHRHAAGGDGPTGNQSSDRSLSLVVALALLLYASVLFPPVTQNLFLSRTRSFMLKANTRNNPAHCVDRQTPGTVPSISSAVMTDESERMFLSRPEKPCTQ